MASNENLVNVAIEKARIAIKLDQSQRYQEAYDKYIDSIQTFLTAIKNEKKGSRNAILLQKKTGEFMRRAEEIKTILKNQKKTVTAPKPQPIKKPAKKDLVSPALKMVERAEYLDQERKFKEAYGQYVAAIKALIAAMKTEEKGSKKEVMLRGKVESLLARAKEVKALSEKPKPRVTVPRRYTPKPGNMGNSGGSKRPERERDVRKVSSWNNSNVSNIGSKDDLQQRVETARTEIEWKGAGEKNGIEIWRIENFGVKRWPKLKYGSFFGGDCYIVLHTKGFRKWDVYFWIGGESTIGIRIMRGGVDSGFRHVAPKEYKPRLLWIKGKKYVRTTEVALSPDSLNLGDVFILDQGERVLIWTPKKASAKEKYKAGQVAQEIRNSRKGKLAEERLDEEGSEEFWRLLGCGKKPSRIKSEDEVQSDTEFDEMVSGKFPKSLFRLCDASGKMTFSCEQRVGKDELLDSRKLDTMDVFIIDGGEEVLAWIGKGASRDERRKAILFATSFIGMQHKPVWTRIVRVEEGREGDRFWSLFRKK